MTTVNDYADQQISPVLIAGGRGSLVPIHPSALPKPTRHRKATSDTSWFSDPLGSIKDTLISHKFDSADTINNRYSAPILSYKHGETIEKNSSHKAKRQGVNHGHSRSTDNRTRLGDQLDAVLRNDTMNGRLYVPRSGLDEVVTQEAVERELARPVHLLAKLSPKVWHTGARLRIGSSSEQGDAGRTSTEQTSPIGLTNGSFQQIFAILLLIDRPTKIWAFLREGVCDADLPLKPFPPSQHGQLNTLTRLQSHKNPMVSLKCLKKRRDISSFLEKQWIVCVPVFKQSSRKEDSHITASDQQSLPFDLWEPTDRIGTFAEIYRANIHSSHCNFDEGAVS
jgi:hypothetical protein